jgi:hypothetical protein
MNELMKNWENERDRNLIRNNVPYKYKNINI